MGLENKKIVVVGGSSGMGLATASALAASGAQVLIASRSEEKLQKARRSVSRPVETRVLDTRNEPEIADFFRDLGGFDHLVISAADAVFGPFLEVPTAQVQDFFESKFWGAYRVCALCGASPCEERFDYFLLWCCQPAGDARSCRRERNQCCYRGTGAQSCRGACSHSRKHNRSRTYRYSGLERPDEHGTEVSFLQTGCRKITGEKNRNTRRNRSRRPISD